MANPVRVEAEVVEVNNYYDGIVGYTFKPFGRVPRFAPGQFMHLTIDTFDHGSQWPESRVFSISSSPADKENLKIIISKKGYYTTRIVAELKLGSRVWLKLPYGDFTFDTDTENIVLIGGGTGMAPFISFIEECVTEERQNYLWIYYGVRREEHLVYHHFLKEIQGQLKNVSIRIFVEDDMEDGTNGYYPGIIDIEKVLSETKNLDPSYYLSGPWAMIDNFRKQLLENNIAPQKILIDEWS